MSRSRRKSPIKGTTTARSEKKDKRLHNRALRHATTQKLKTYEDSSDVLPHRMEITNPWTMAKDGKARFDPKKNPKLMRK